MSGVRAGAIESTTRRSRTATSRTSTEDTSGELFEATNWIEPRMPGPPVHVHPTAEESYEVIEGALEVFMNGEWTPVHAGEKATAAAGAPHSVRNGSDEPARIVNIHRPAQRFESFFRDRLWR
jgi:mannose-6-phosphate isomerase-like protein (cupin superfamily)